LFRYHLPPQDENVKLNINGSCGASGDISTGGLLRDNKGYWIAGFSSKEGQGNELLAELFGVYHGLMLVINNSIQQVIYQTNSLEVLHLLQYPDPSHVYASLLMKIFVLKKHIPDASFRHVLKEDNRCANFLAKLGRSSRKGVTFWRVPPPKLESMLGFYQACSSGCANSSTELSHQK
jgi:hypothetical protein